MTDTERVLQSANTLRVILEMWEYESKIKDDGSKRKLTEEERARNNKAKPVFFIFAFSVFSLV